MQAIAKHQQCERLLHKIREGNRTAATQSTVDESGGELPSPHIVDQEPLPNCPPDVHYQITQSNKYYWEVTTWLSHHRNDMALEVSNGIPSMGAEIDTPL